MSGSPGSGAPIDLDALRGRLRDCAKAGEPETYLSLAEALQLDGPHRIHRLTLALEELVREDHRAGQPLLAALAVSRVGIPGRGFFMLLGALGRYSGAFEGKQAEEHYRQELRDAIAFWGGLNAFW